MRVVVTGGSGRLGQHVVRELFSRGHQVSVLDAIKPRECLCPTYAVDLTKTRSLFDHFKGVECVVHLARRRFPYIEAGFDVEAQRRELIDESDNAELFNINVAITNNVLTAVRAAEAKKIVCGSSLAVYGFYYPVAAFAPDCLPIDEEHPLRPQDPYGLSKFVGETLCEAASRTTGVQVASLRFARIHTEEQGGMLIERGKDPLVQDAGALWSYVDVRDAARACRLALEADFPGHQAFNICAPDTMVDRPTAELVRQYLPRVKTLRKSDGRWSCYETAKAERMLGFRAMHLLRT